MLNAKRVNKFIVLFLAVIVVAAIVFAPSVAYADNTAASYGGKTADQLWYFGEDYLNLASAKQIVASWDKTKLASIGTIYIAVIDTGINTSHEIFSDTLARNGSGDVLGYNAHAGYYGKGSTTDITDTSNYHGTGVAGIIAMLIKEFGLQDSIKIYPIKANNANSDKDSFEIKTIIHALDWAVSDDIDVDVINLSLGLLRETSEDWATSKSLQYSLNEAAKTATIVAAAGNDSKDSSVEKDVFYPAGLDGVVAVMGYGKNGKLYSTSNYGNSYDIVAPGENIYTAKAYSRGSGTSSYDTKTGTSMASPFVSFASALLKLRLLYEGTINESFSANGLARMLLHSDFDTIDQAPYIFKSLDLLTILTYDYSTAGYEYLSPTDIYLTYPTEYYDDVLQSFYMISNNIQKLTLNATITPFGETNPDLDDVVEWYIVDGYQQEQFIGRGLSITYAPSKGGSYKIIIKLKYDQVTYSDEVAWAIEYVPFFAAEARVTYKANASDDVDVAPTGGFSYEKDVTQFTLTGIEYVNKDVDINWYVNGEYAYSGEVFDFSTNVEGNYIISCDFDGSKIDGQYSFNLEVRPRIEKPENLAILGICCGIALLSLILGIVFGIRRSKFKKPLSKTLMKEEYEA